jgi:hypothetical protein
VNNTTTTPNKNKIRFQILKFCKNKMSWFSPTLYIVDLDQCISTSFDLEILELRHISIQNGFHPFTDFFCFIPIPNYFFYFFYKIKSLKWDIHVSTFWIHMFQFISKWLLSLLLFFVYICQTNLIKIMFKYIIKIIKKWRVLQHTC